MMSLAELAKLSTSTLERIYIDTDMHHCVSADSLWLAVLWGGAKPTQTWFGASHRPRVARLLQPDGPVRAARLRSASRW